MNLLTSLILSIFALVVVSAKEFVKEINELPGWSGNLPSKMYTGYFEVAEGSKSLHFMFLESMSSPSTDPVMIWLQGGPGASGLMGLFTEFGPFNLNQYSYGASSPQENPSILPSLQENPYTWLKYANYIVVESPVGVGFSECSASECPVNTDHSQAEDLYEFVQKFFQNFPDYQQNDFYVTGESYGGLYVPMLANKIHENNNEESNIHINMKGILIGNGCTGVNSDGSCSADSMAVLSKFLHGRGQISTATYEQLSKCPPTNPPSDECSALMEKAYYESGKYYFYHIFDECFIYENANSIPPKPVNDYPCFFEDAITHWANHPETKKFFNSDKQWYQIQKGPDGGPWDQYQQTVTNVIAYYETLLSAGYKVTIYFGDVDTAVSAVGGEMAAYHLGKNQKQDWSPWTVDGDNVAGYSMEYGNNFTFITVRGAGHMVPQNRPAEAEALFKSFAQGKPLTSFYN